MIRKKSHTSIDERRWCLIEGTSGTLSDTDVVFWGVTKLSALENNGN